MTCFNACPGIIFQVLIIFRGISARVNCGMPFAVNMIWVKNYLHCSITDHAQRTWFDEDPSKGSKRILMPAYGYPVGKDASVQLKKGVKKKCYKMNKNS